MSDSCRLLLPPPLLPGSPAALAWLDRELAGISPAEHIELDEAWMVGALPHREERLRELASSRLLSVGDGFVSLDPYALSSWQAPNRAVAEQIAARLPGAEVVPRSGGPSASGDEHSSRAGLCLEQRALADRLATRDLPELYPGLLPALSPAGIGGCGDAVTEDHALSLLRSACAAAGIEDEGLPSLPEAKPLPRRVRQLALESANLDVAWSRSRGVSWTLGGLRPTFLPFSLEVQGDLGGRGPFVPGHPIRPRLFEARFMRPVHHTPEGEVRHLSLERELRLPEDPEQPKGRRLWMGWSLVLTLDVARSELDVWVQITNLAPGHRYRLWLPIPFHPRPSALRVLGPLGTIDPSEPEGPFPLTPVEAPVEMKGPGGSVRIRGAGLREVELFPNKNDWICAITLLRTPAGEAAPARVVRRVTVGVGRRGERGGPETDAERNRRH